MVLISERPPKSQIELSRGTGKAISSSARVAVRRSGRWWSARAAMSSCSTCRTAAPPRTCAAALTRQIAKLPAELRRTLTWDQGKEMASHVRFTTDTNMQVYFCDPHSPWQRGATKNTNGLLRQYFRATLTSACTVAAHLNAVAKGAQQPPSTNPA